MLDHITWDLFFKLFYKKRPLRPWTNQAHISNENVKKLRHLINTGLSYKTAYRSNTGIMRGCPLVLFFIWILYFHGTEFKHFKRTVVQSDPLLAVNDRTWRSKFDQCCCQQHKRRKQDDSKQCATDIYHTLYSCIKYAGKRYMADMDHRKSLKIFHIRDRRDNVIVIRNKFGMHT